MLISASMDVATLKFDLDRGSPQRRPPGRNQVHLSRRTIRLGDSSAVRWTTHDVQRRQHTSRTPFTFPRLHWNIIDFNSTAVIRAYPKGRLLPLQGGGGVWKHFRLHFTARCVCIVQTMLLQDVRLSIRLSYAGILSKQLNMSSNFLVFFHHRVSTPMTPF